MAAHRVVVIGAGAVGAMAAIHAALAGSDVILLERTRDGGRKILASGGGRCNILPSVYDERRILTDSSHNSLRKILASWPLEQQRRFFEEEIGLPLSEESESRKLFPASGRAIEVRDRLFAVAKQHGARLMCGARVNGLEARGASWRVMIDGQSPVDAAAIVLATGGASYPETGSDGCGFGWLERLGHDVRKPYPALTTLEAKPAPHKALAGVSIEATVTAVAGEERAEARGGFLFTHHGYSGPSVLDISHVVVRSLLFGKSPARVHVRWTGLGEEEWGRALGAAGSRTVAGALKREMPDRLAEMLIHRAGVAPARTLAQLKREERMRLIDVLTRFELPWTGHGGYARAETTGGGVNLSEVDPRTMESRKAPGLYICGELLDAFGLLGGYNFLWAWVTGRAAGRGVGAGR